MQPLILLGTERSGTNLLRRTLEAHSEIASAPPSGLIANMARYRHLYLNGYVENGFRSWVRAALALIDAHPSDWELNISEDEVISRVGDNLSHWRLFEVLNELYAEKKRASYWFSKEPGALDWGYELLAYIPNIKFVYLVRDGRDVAASMLKGGVHEQHIYGAAKRWKHDQLRAMQYLSDSVIKERTFIIRYEDFIADDVSVSKELFDFIGCDYDDKVTLAYEQETIKRHARNSEFWYNLSKPVMKDNFGKYKKSLSRSQINVFESICRKELEFFGYPCESTEDIVLSSVTRGFMLLQTRINRIANKRDKNIKEEFDKRAKFSEISSNISQGRLF